MKRILVPIDDSPNAMFAIRHIVRQFLSDSAMELHLLNVQAPFSQHIAQFSSRRSRQETHREQAELALAPARKKLDEHSIPYAVHYEIGDSAKAITETARRLRCDEILMSTGRKSALARLIEDSVAIRVLELSTVPVELIPGAPMTKLERFGLPAALAAAAAALVAAID